MGFLEMIDLSSLDKYPKETIFILIGQYIGVSCKKGRKIYGKLHAFDYHLNILLENVHVTTKLIKLDAENLNESFEDVTDIHPFFFIRGEIVTSIQDNTEKIVRTKI